MNNFRIHQFFTILSACIWITCANRNDAVNPTRESIVQSIPIRPMDYKTVQRLSYQLAPPINPDSEQIFLPLNGDKYKPHQIMERIVAPTDRGISDSNRKKKAHFDPLNFDAYMVKPMNFNYKTVLATLKPQTERILQNMNKTYEHNDDAKPSSSSQHKTAHAPKKHKKDRHLSHMKEFNDYDYYKAFVDQQKYAAAMKKLQSKRVPPPMRNANKYSHPNTKLPIGFDYFLNKNKNAFPPITFAPVPIHVNNFHRPHRQEAAASNIYNVKIKAHPFEMLEGETEPMLTTTGTIPAQASQAVEVQGNNQFNYNRFANVNPVEIPLPTEAKNYHSLAKMPEMYKFTIEDAVIRPQASNINVVKSFDGPVTLAPLRTFDDLNAQYINTENIPPPPPPPNPNILFENYPSSTVSSTLTVSDSNTPHYFEQNNYPKSRYRRLERHRQNIAEAPFRRQHYKPDMNPHMITTQMPIVVANSQNDFIDAPSTDALDSKSAEQRNKRRKLVNNRKTTSQTDMDTKQNENQRRDNFNLEVSSSYTKQRNQGYNSEEEPATTPITLKKIKNQKSFANETSQDIAAVESQRKQRRQAIASAESQRKRRQQVAPKLENAKYFQDIFTEQSSPFQIDFGHLSENPFGWEERYERKNLKSHRHQGKVKWSDKKGGFGEHYYDLNHHLPVQPDLSKSSRT